MRFTPREWLPAAALFLTAQYEVWVAPLFAPDLGGPREAMAAMAALFTLPLLWRRRRPVAAFALVLVGALVHVKVANERWLVPTDEGMVQAWFAALIAFYSVATHAPPREATLAGIAGGALLVANDLPQLIEGVTTLNHTLPAWFILGGAWGLGYALRGRTREAAEAAARERARIARELHDVVAHSLSVMVIQAQAAERVLEGAEPSAREALASIDATGRQALAEMRRLVGMLREREPELAPQPSLDDLEGLVAKLRDTGLAVEARVEGEPRPLAPGVDLAAYRIVQEALTNVLKHAGPASARVVVRFRAGELELEISDDGRGAGDGPPGGHGLAGMRERVAVYGGELEAGTLNGNGFRVRARLPA